jgi:hypothetical protein
MRLAELVLAHEKWDRVPDELHGEYVSCKLGIISL